MERQNPLLATLYNEQPRGFIKTRRQSRREPRMENHGKYEVGSGIDEDALVNA